MGQSSSEKGVFWKRGLFRKVHHLEILEKLKVLELLENHQTVENKGKSDRFLENLENSEIPPTKRPPFVMTPFSGPDLGREGSSKSWSENAPEF